MPLASAPLPDVILMVAVALTVGAVAEIAVIATLFPDGTLVGAVYCVAAALAVCAGLNEPQAPLGTQLQFTPPFDESPATVAAMLAVAPVVNEPGGGVVNVTVI